MNIMNSKVFTLASIAISLIIFSVFMIVSGCGTVSSSSGGGSTPPTIIWVSTTGSDESGNGSEANPYLTINKALFSAGSGNIICLKEGLYQETTTWPATAHLTVKGESKLATVEEDGCVNGIFRIYHAHPADSSITFEDLTLRNGSISGNGGAIYFNLNIPLYVKNVDFIGNSAYSGAAIYLQGGSLVAENCSFTGGSATSTNANQGGGAVYVVSGRSFYARCCVFDDNGTRREGAQVHNRGSATLESCVLTNGSSEADGGGIFNTGTVHLKKCTIEANSALIKGGGICNTGTFAEGRVENCVITHNRGFDGGGMFDDSSVTINIINCTFVSNEAGCSGGGIWADDNTRMSNCIFWGNSHNQIGTSGGPFIEYSDVEGGYTDTGGGMVDVDPDFVSYPNEPLDLRLQASSTLEVTRGGTGEGAPSEDFNGKPRSKADGKVSMGAYEYP